MREEELKVMSSTENTNIQNKATFKTIVPSSTESKGELPEVKSQKSVHHTEEVKEEKTLEDLVDEALDDTANKTHDSPPQSQKSSEHLNVVENDVEDQKIEEKNAGEDGAIV